MADVSGDGKLKVENLVDVVSEMNEEALRLKTLSDQMREHKDSDDPAASLNMLQSLLGQLGGGDSKLLDLSDKLKSIADRFEGLSPGERAEFEAKARAQLGSKMEEIQKLAGRLAAQAGEDGGAGGLLQPYGHATILLCSLVVIAIFAFFGYKLYKSLKDKEVKREEKRRLKQLKKKK